MCMCACVCDQTERLLTSPLGSGPSSAAASCQETETSIFAKTHTHTHTFCSPSLSLSVSLCSSLNLNLCFLSLKSLFLSPSASLHLVPWILCQYLSGFLSISQFTPQSLSSLYSSPEMDDSTSLVLLSSLCSLPSFILSKTCPPLSLFLSRSYLVPHYVCYNHMRASFTHHASRCDIAVG